jgi:hypothetical protein
MYPDEKPWDVAEWDDFCDEFLIPRELRENFEERFLWIASFLISSRSNEIDAATRREIKKTLTTVERNLSGLVKALSKLNRLNDASAYHPLQWSFQDSLRHPRTGYPNSNTLDETDWDPFNEPPIETLEEHKSHAVQEAIGTMFLSRTVRMVQETALSQLESIVPHPRGPKEDDDLKFWLGHIRNLWVDFLNRRFTRDVTNEGQPISEAARFCVRACQLVDPKTPPSRILNEMKKIITEDRKTATGRIP